MPELVAFADTRALPPSPRLGTGVAKALRSAWEKANEGTKRTSFQTIKLDEAPLTGPLRPAGHAGEAFVLGRAQRRAAYRILDTEFGLHHVSRLQATTRAVVELLGGSAGPDRDAFPAGFAPKVT